MTYAGVPHRNYWHSSEVKPEGRRPEGFTELRANNYGVARALAYVITNLWYELTCLHGYRGEIFMNVQVNYRPPSTMGYDIYFSPHMYNVDPLQNTPFGFSKVCACMC